MNNKFTLTIILSALCLSSTSTYAAPNASLWGSIDQPVPPIQQIEQQQKEIEIKQEEIANQKTICELLSAQPALTTDTTSAAKIRDAVAQAYKLALPDYKMFLVSSDAANSLYAKYRDLYIKTYCTTGAR